MITARRTGLKPLLESQGGLHLTAYLTAEHDRSSQVQDALKAARGFLEPALVSKEIERFLEPLQSLGRDTGFLGRLEGNIGLFRTGKSFRILRLPIDVEPMCVVATSFHVKPILKWLQIDRDFLLLGLAAESASLYLGSQSSFQLLDAVCFVHSKPNTHERALETADWLNEVLNGLSQETEPKLFIAGEVASVQRLLARIHYRKFHSSLLRTEFHPDLALELCFEIRGHLLAEAKTLLKGSLVEFYEADVRKLARKNIFQIAKAAVQGRIRKLIVADGIQIFGKLDPRTGGLSIHPTDLDHEDDDLLDDLAQTVLARGGEVVVAPRDEIPKGYPVLAILERPELESREERISVELPPRHRNYLCPQPPTGGFPP